MNILTIAAGPVIGSIIGYLTNYLAVKMLFRPLHPRKIGKWTLPFTPGIVPKRKEQLAKALGNAVGNNLLTSEDVESMFLTENIKKKIVKEICNLLYTRDDNHTIKNLLSGFFQQDNYQCMKEQLEKMICEKIMLGFSKLDMGTIIAKESSRVIREKTQGTLLAMVANDKLIAALVVPIGEKVEAYVNKNSTDTIRSIVKEEIVTLENQPIGNLVSKISIEEEYIIGLIEKIYTEIIQKKIGGIIKQFDIAGVVEQKVNDMNVLEMEKLVLSVMKKELNAIVNLGALIGFIIGLLNIFV